MNRLISYFSAMHFLTPQSHGSGKAARLWISSALIALLANVIIIITLPQVSHLRHSPPSSPMLVRTFNQREALPPPRSDSQPDPPMASPADVMTMPLPNIDVPEVSLPTSLSMPIMENLDALPEMPLSIPIYTTIDNGTLPTDANSTLTTSTQAPDTPAVREGDLDLDHYYPQAARLNAITGITRMRIAIDANGIVSDVQILKSTPTGVFDQAAVRLGRSLRFRPAQAAGKVVATSQVTTIQWTIK